VLGATPVPGDKHADVIVRDAALDDVPALRRLLAAAFDEAEEDDAAVTKAMSHPGTRQLIIERAGDVVGCLRLFGDDERTGVFGFAVEPRWQGQGIGRAVLHRVAAELRASGVRNVTLEVEVDNESALGLYTSVGFEPRVTEDYFAVSARALSAGTGPG
jgi:ribosomal protein S18 acetylase RimI-like enzyme